MKVKFVFVFYFVLIALFSVLVFAASFDNVKVAAGVKPGDVINQGKFTFTVDSTSLQGGAVLKVNGVALILNPGVKIRFDEYDIVSSKGATGVDVSFTKVNAQVAQPVAASSSKESGVSDANLKVNPEAVNVFNKITNGAFKDFNFRTKTKGDTYIVSAWKKIKTPASVKDGIDSYTFFRGIVMCIDKNTNLVKCHYSTN